MRCRLILISMMLATLILAGISFGHAQPRSPGGKASTKQLRKRKVMLSLGYVLLPEGYKAYRNKSGVDTWSGYIVSPDGNFRIDIYGSMVISPFGTDEDKFIWTKVEGKSTEAVKIGLKSTDNGEMVVASSIWVNFSAPAKREGDIDLFLRIVRSFRDKKCNGCEEMLPAPPSNKSLERRRK